MKLSIDYVIGQLYITPYIKITHSTWLNGSRELIIGWMNYQLTLSI